MHMCVQFVGMFSFACECDVCVVLFCWSEDPRVPARELLFSRKAFCDFCFLGVFRAPVPAGGGSQRGPTLFRAGSEAVFGLKSVQVLKWAWAPARVSLRIDSSTHISAPSSDGKGATFSNYEQQSSFTAPGDEVRPGATGLGVNFADGCCCAPSVCGRRKRRGH